MKNKTTVSDLAEIIEKCKNSITELTAEKEDLKKEIEEKNNELKKMNILISRNCLHVPIYLDEAATEIKRIALIISDHSKTTGATTMTIAAALHLMDKLIDKLEGLPKCLNTQ